MSDSEGPTTHYRRNLLTWSLNSKIDNIKYGSLLLNLHHWPTGVKSDNLSDVSLLSADVPIATNDRTKWLVYTSNQMFQEVAT